MPAKTPRPDRAAAERPRFYPRQVVTPADLALIVDHLRARQRRHNRLLHGWGIVRGGEVVADPKDFHKVTVSPGFFLAPSGDEFEIPAPVTLDVFAGPAAATTSGSPWSSDRGLGPDTATDWKQYLVVRYVETPAGKARVAPAACGCDESPCEPTRLLDCYQFNLVEELPPGHGLPNVIVSPSVTALADPASKGDYEFFVGDSEEDQFFRPIEPPADWQWIVLAKLKFDSVAGTLKADMLKCRRHVVSLASLWHRPAKERPQT